MNRCKTCSAELEGRRYKFCSKKCKVVFETASRSKKPKYKTCKHCVTKFIPYTSLDKFCSANCRIENQKSKRSKRWSSVKNITGDKNPAYRNGMYARGSKRSNIGEKQFLRNRNEMRKEMLKVHGHLFCEFCGVNNSYQWEMHHIIYRSEKPLHEHLHDKKNLINLCMKCHNEFHKDKGVRDALVLTRGLHLLFGNDVLSKSHVNNI